MSGLLQPVQAQIAAPPFQQGQSQRQAKQIGQIGQIPCEQLILQGLGCRGHQRTLTSQQCRHQIGEGLANARARLDYQCIVFHDGACDRQRHVPLPATLAIMRVMLGQWPARRKKVQHLLFQCALRHFFSGVAPCRCQTIGHQRPDDWRWSFHSKWRSASSWACRDWVGA